MGTSTSGAAPHAERLGRGDAAPIMSLSSQIWGVGSLLTSYVTSELDASGGVPLADAEVLMATRVRGDRLTTPADLRSQLHLTSAGITKRIDQVEAKGLLERRPHPSDRRSVTLHLTTDGVARADETIRLVAGIMHALLDDDLGADDVESLTEGLERLRARLTSLVDD